MGVFGANAGTDIGEQEMISDISANILLHYIFYNFLFYFILFYSIAYIAIIVFNCSYLFFFITYCEALWFTERVVVKGCINKEHLHLHII